MLVFLIEYIPASAVRLVPLHAPHILPIVGRIEQEHIKFDLGPRSRRAARERGTSSAGSFLWRLAVGTAGQYHWPQSMAHAGIDQCRGRSAGKESACEAREYRRPMSALGLAHGERTRAHHQDPSGARECEGRDRRRPLIRGAAELLRLLKKGGKRRKDV